MIRTLRFFLILTLLVRFKAFADPADPFFVQHYDNRNGLSNSSINHIFRDADNLLWIATWDGLNMYDGTSFHVFNYSKENDFKSIGSNVIQFITEDRSGNIWISTIEGISRFEKKTGKFYNYFYNHNQRSKISEQEYTLTIDTAGNVYCLNQKEGLTCYDPATDSFRKTLLPQGASNISKIAFDKRNHLWVLNSRGELNSYDVRGDQFRMLNSYSNNKTIINFFNVNNQIFFTTGNDQLFSIDNNSFLQKPLLHMKHGISSMIFYKDHYLLAWNAKGYGVYDNNFRESSFLKRESQQMQGIMVTSWTLGSEDILWYGTDGNGIIKVYPKTKSFGTIATAGNGVPYNRSVRAFCEENGNLWVGTKGSGIIQYTNFWTTPPSSINKRYFLSPSELDNNAVYCLQKGNEDLIYIGTDGKGLGVYDQKSKKFNKWSDINGHDTYAEFGSVYDIFQDTDSSLWLGTSGYGLVHLKIKRDLRGKLTLLFLDRYMFNNSNKGPANDIIYALAAGDDGQLWIGCRYGGLNLLNKKTKEFKTFKAFTYEGSLSNNDVLSIYKDSRNRVWIGTSYGLNWIDNADALRNEPVFQKLTTENGLPNNTIHTIEEDRTGHVWISTNKGLAKVNQADLKVWNYQQSDGLQSNEFCDGAVWKDKSDNLFFGGTYGFNHFLPQDIRKTSWRPNLLLSGLLIGGQTRENGYLVLDPDNNRSQDFSISRKNNFFELNIKAISFLNAEKCEYAYFLKGYDKTWQTPATTGKITYNNIPPGDYTLHIKWSNGDGIWTNEKRLFHLEVKQYFWLTPYAFLFYFIVLSFLAIFIYNYRKNKLEIKHQLEVEHLMRTKEEQIHQDRLGFFTNIAHELQTPLTLIMGSAERFLDKKNSIRVHREKPYFLSLIHQQASRLAYLVQQLMEFRKVEAGFYKNQYSYLNISDLLNNLAEPFLPLSEQKGMIYELNILPDIAGWADKDKLEKIIFNLLSNAFKHSGSNEQIIFLANENKETAELEITIKNSGIQLPPDQLNQLFDKFYVANQQGVGTASYGTGIGLAFTRQLVTLLHGSISVSSGQGWIIFKVRLPLTIAEETADNKVRSDQPSYLYKAITSYTEPVNTISTIENNKQAVIDNLKEKDRKTILIVEDEPGIRYLMKDILKDDYIIYEAEDGQKALDLIEKTIPHLVICDVLMPIMNGLELCNQMKNAPATCQIPFILLSARNSELHHMEGYEVGADAYIAKPFHTAHLLLRIRKLLEYRQKIHDLFKDDKATDLLSESDMIDTDKAFLTQLVQQIEEKLDDTELNATSIEKTFSMSKMQLYRKLKTLTGMTPAEFIKHIRLKRAAQLLISTNYTVSEIFYRTGFNNQSYFFREFKKRYNCAPNEYREQQTVQG